MSQLPKPLEYFSSNRNKLLRKNSAQVPLLSFLAVMRAQEPHPAWYIRAETRLPSGIISPLLQTLEKHEVVSSEVVGSTILCGEEVPTRAYCIASDIAFAGMVTSLALLHMPAAYRANYDFGLLMPKTEKL